MLSNAYFLAKFRFDTAENEPAKKLQNFANFPNFANPNPSRDAVGPGTHPLSSFELGGRVLHLRRQVRGLGDRVDVVVVQILPNVVPEGNRKLNICSGFIGFDESCGLIVI